MKQIIGSMAYRRVKITIFASKLRVAHKNEAYCSYRTWFLHRGGQDTYLTF